MDVISHTSTLNPSAPLFVPLAYRTVEDFSDQWWALVHSSPWFRDYWIQECFSDPQVNSLVNDIYDSALPDDIDSLFFHGYVDDSNINKQEVKEEENEHNKELVSVEMMKWQKGRAQLAQAPKYAEKAPRVVNVRVSPRMIQQPR